MLLGLSISITFLGIMKKNSKYLFIVFFLLLWVLFGFATDHADYENYISSFLKTQNKGFYGLELGHQLLLKFFHLFHVEFQTYLVLSSLLFLLIFIKSVKFYNTENLTFILILFFIFPFIINVVQIRNFYSSAIILYSTRFLISENKSANIKYIFFVIIAASIHYSAFFYLTFLLIKFKKDKNLILTIAIFIILSFILTYSGLLSSILSIIFVEQKFSNWFIPKMGLGFIYLFVIHAFTTFLVYYSYEKIKNYNYKLNNIPKTKYKFNLRIAELIYRINIIMFLLFPLYAFNIEFFRIYRNMYIFFYILFSITINYGISKKSENLIFQTLVLALAIFLSLNFIIIPFYDTVFHPIFFNNLIL